MYQHPRNISKKIRKISDPELEISLYSTNLSKEVSQLIDWQTYKSFKSIWNWCRNIPQMSPKNFRKISYPDLEISQYLCNFSKKVSQVTDWQTYKNSDLFWTSLPASKKCLQKKSERYLIQNWIYPFICIISVRM